MLDIMLIKELQNGIISQQGTMNTPNSILCVFLNLYFETGY